MVSKWQPSVVMAAQVGRPKKSREKVVFVGKILRGLARNRSAIVPIALGLFFFAIVINPEFFV